MHLLLVALLASIVHLSSPRQLGKDEVFVKLDGGFPDGSLLTVFVKHTLIGNTVKGTMGSIGVNLYEDLSTDKGRLHFRLDSDENVVSRRGQDGGGWHPQSPEVEGKTFIKSVIKAEYRPASYKSGSWWRFDLYKISETEYLPFFNGFAVKKRTLPPGGKTSAVYIVPSTNDVSGEINYDKDDVYVTVKHPETSSCKLDKCNPALVLEALDKTSVDAKRDDAAPRTDFLTLEDGFKVGKKIRLSALMMSGPRSSNKPEEDDIYQNNMPSIFFVNEEESWGLGVNNVFTDNSGSALVKMFLFVENKVNGEWPRWVPNPVDCTPEGTTGVKTSTDIVHLKLWRPIDSPNTVKVRTYYKDGSPGGVTCKIDLGANAVMLEGKLKVQGKHSAVLLHFDMV